MIIDQHVESELHQLLIEDARISEQGIRIVRAGDGVSLVGEVESAERRDLICRVVAEAFPDLPVRCNIGLTRVQEPQDVEEL
ncbi:hypothetical protein ACFO1B_36080 [Dactylosporangium siamense]|uniref:BON domain-containing protein n=1 Tax=Dactylosporangium siamense TaxID=685454 RepID=A0A919PP85_9ACTN|nr:hypothetical protein [Dactylosporangium siamense]GIG45995.1 hypothetical protein Dsi01nite_040360 [Dactylosporangium siamense]